MKMAWVFGMAIAAGITFGTAGQSRAQSEDRMVDQYTCKEIMRESGAPREIAIAFLHGYFVGKAGTLKFNIGAIQKQTDSFVENCLESPNAKALDVMTKVKG